MLPSMSASDRYLAIVIPGKMYAKAYKTKAYIPSIYLELSKIRVQSLQFWCLGILVEHINQVCLAFATGELFYLCSFRWLSPIMTLIFAFFNIKLKAFKGSRMMYWIKMNHFIKSVCLQIVFK